MLLPIVRAVEAASIEVNRCWGNQLFQIAYPALWTYIYNSIMEAVCQLDDVVTGVAPIVVLRNVNHQFLLLTI